MGLNWWMFGDFVRPLSRASCCPRPRQPELRWRRVFSATCALVCSATAAWSCSDSSHDVCARAIIQQAACDPNLAGSAGPEADAINACGLQLDTEAPSCREASRRLADCIAQNACADIDEVCFGGQQGVQFNCSNRPFLK